MDAAITISNAILISGVLFLAYVLIKEARVAWKQWQWKKKQKDEKAVQDFRELVRETVEVEILSFLASRSATKPSRKKGSK